MSATATAGPLERRAEKVTGAIAAARLRDDLAFTLATNTSPATQEDADRAISDLERRFPELEDVEIGQAEDFARSRGKGRKEPGELDNRGRVTVPRKAPRSRSSSSSSSTRSSSTRKRAGAPPRSSSRRSSSRSSSRRSSSRLGPRGRRAIEQTGLPSAGRTASALVLQVLGATVGLALIYLLVSNAQTAQRGRSAIELVAGGLVTATRRAVAPVDPLAGGAVQVPYKELAGGLAGAGPPGSTVRERAADHRDGINSWLGSLIDQGKHNPHRRAGAAIAGAGAAIPG